MDFCNRQRAGELLVDVGIGFGAACVSWCHVNGMVAVGARLQDHLACVHLLNLHCVTRKVTLLVPLQGSEDGIAALSWSPIGCRRVLLVATVFGKLTAWTQQPPDPSRVSQTRITVEDWWSQDVADLSAAEAGDSKQTCADTVRDGSCNRSSAVRLVNVRWLEAAPSWEWNSSVAQQTELPSNLLHSIFAPGSNNLNQDSAMALDGSTAPPDLCSEFHWVRPGTLALAAVLSNGTAVLCWAQWSAYGQLQWTTSSMALATGSTIEAADAVVCSEGVVVCYTLQQDQSTIHVAKLQGNPLHLQSGMLDTSHFIQLLVVPVLPPSQSAVGGSITALSWDPASNGSRLASVRQPNSSTEDGSGIATATSPGNSTASSAILTVFALKQGQLTQEGQLACGAAATQLQLAWVLDGLVLWSGGHGLQLYHLDPLQQASARFEAPASRALARLEVAGSSSRPVLHALAASPHGVAVAAVVNCSGPAADGGSSSGSSSRLLLYNVPPKHRDSAGLAKSAAWRVLFSLLQPKHSWDLVQHVLCCARQPATTSSSSIEGMDAAAGSGDIQPSVVGDILSTVDAQVALQQPTVKSSFSARWDVVKLAVLGGTPGDDARVVGMDVRLRIICITLRPLFEILREDSAMRQRESRPKIAGLAPFQAYLSDLLTFTVACLKTWVARRAGSSPSGGLPQHVPCVRALLDARGMNVLTLLYMITNAAVVGSSKPDDELYRCCKLAYKAAPPWKDHDWEQVAKALFPGQLNLHYGDAVPDALSSLNLPPEQLMAHMNQSAIWQQQKPLSDAEICAAAVRVGLLPVRTQKAISMYRRVLQQHGSFRLRLQQSDAGVDMDIDCPSSSGVGAISPMPRPASMKRCMWEQQIQDAMGDTLGAGTLSSEAVVSLAQLSQMDTGTPGCLQSVDGAVMVTEGPTPLDDGSKGLGAVPRVILDQCAYGWTYACPVTGEMWIRLGC